MVRINDSSKMSTDRCLGVRVSLVNDVRMLQLQHGERLCQTRDWRGLIWFFLAFAQEDAILHQILKMSSCMLSSNAVFLCLPLETQHQSRVLGAVHRITQPMGSLRSPYVKRDQKIFQSIT